MASTEISIVSEISWTEPYILLIASVKGTRELSPSTTFARAEAPGSTKEAIVLSNRLVARPVNVRIGIAQLCTILRQARIASFVSLAVVVLGIAKSLIRLGRSEIEVWLLPDR